MFYQENAGYFLILMNHLRFFFCFIFGFIAPFHSTIVKSQCCSGGSGSPVAGGSSQGVLLDRQMEINTNFQYINTNKFLEKDHPAKDFLDNYHSSYLYSRLAYGVTKDFTISVESGYYFNKTQIGLNNVDTNTSSGIGDLIIFPRYDIYNRTEEDKRTEITVGLGYKISLGKYSDSAKKVPGFGDPYYLIMPPAVQPTTGSNDFIFYAFVFRGYPLKNFRLFANALYVKKGWNPMGEKFGDYASIGLFAGKTFFEKLGITLQLKGERVDKMQYNKNIDPMVFYNVDPTATGSYKVLLVPQLSYNYKTFTFYALSEFPLYQYVNEIQIASQHQITTGITYRFFPKKQCLTK